MNTHGFVFEAQLIILIGEYFWFLPGTSADVTPAAVEVIKE